MITNASFTRNLVLKLQVGETIIHEISTVGKSCNINYVSETFLTAHMPCQKHEHFLTLLL